MPDDHRCEGRDLVESAPGPVSQGLAVGCSQAKLAHWTQRLVTATTAPNHRACLALTDVMLADGITSDLIGDVIIPEAARSLGNLWCSDNRSFAEVTIGVSRLQTMLRELGSAWSGDISAPVRSSNILLVGIKDDYHTLGALVLAGQLRRMGSSVRVMLSASPSDVGARLEEAAYDAVFLSASHGQRLDALRKIVVAVRGGQSPDCPVVLGGTILVDHPNAVALIGADYASSSPEEALMLCGLAGYDETSKSMLRGT